MRPDQTTGEGQSGTDDERGAQPLLAPVTPEAGNSDVGAALRRGRERAGLTQTALAERIGVSQTCVSYWEAGKRDMGAGDLVKAAAALGIPAVSLLLPGEAAPIFLGEYARVEIMGHDSRTGWVTDGSLAGSACLDVRDDTGRLIAKIPPHSVYMYLPVEHPGAGRPAIAAAPEDAWWGDNDSVSWEGEN